MDNAQDALTALLLQRLLCLATLNADGEPEASSTPYFWDGHHFYVFVSGLAAHTQNLRTNPAVSVLIAEDEGHLKQPFARRRASFQCVATLEAIPEPHLTRMADRLGPIVNMLASLPDFVLFKLRPVSGRLVSGFGAAYTLRFDPLSVGEPVRGG